MNLIKIQFFYLLFCLTFVSACSAGNANPLENLDANQSEEILLKSEVP